jgi:hypothetical protein
MRLFKPSLFEKAFFIALAVAQSLHKKSNNLALLAAILLTKNVDEKF